MEESLNNLCHHPLPSWQRLSFLSLDGLWEYQEYPFSFYETFLTPALLPQKLSSRIVVPFAPGSPASGISKLPRGTMVYRKQVTCSYPLARLVFLAVDYQCRVFFNGAFLGEQRGGYTPFSFLVKPKEGKNEILVLVRDTSSLYQIRGKQAPYFPFLVMYTPASGIWQTPYLEPVTEAHLLYLHFFPEARCVLVRGAMKGALKKAKLLLTFSTGKEVEVKLEGSFRFCFSLKPDFPEWSPEKPELVMVEAQLSINNKIKDKVRTFFGYRIIEAKKSRLFLNGKYFFPNFLLVQGYYPGGWYTGTLNQFQKDIQFIKKAGYNGLRLHQKIEAPRFLTLCDLEGLVLWAEMPSFYRFGRKTGNQFFKEWKDVLRRDMNHPSIICWVPFNESWGIWSLLWNKKVRKFVEKAYFFTKKQDPTRLVIDNSGFEHCYTDILDIHQYLPERKRLQAFLQELYQPSFYSFSLLKFLLSYLSTRFVHPCAAPGFSYQRQPVVISEYGGFGYYKLKGYATALEALRDFALLQAKHPLIQGLCYTQAYDVQQEKNGLLDFERNPKFPLEAIKKINEELEKIVRRKA